MDGVWRTVGGRRIFIKDGEDLESAMKNSGKFEKKKEKKAEDMSLKELKTIVYELGIDEAYENPNITKEELLDYYYDYMR